MSRLSVHDARQLAAAAIDMSSADAVEVIVVSEDAALTRFANNHIHQNVAETTTQVSVRAIVGQRQGVSSTTRLDREGLAAVNKAAHEAACIAPTDVAFPGLPGSEPIAHLQRASVRAQEFGPTARAHAARGIIAASAERGLNAAGTVEVTDTVVAIASTRTVDAAQESTEVAASVLSMTPSGGAGWASFIGMCPDGLNPLSLGLEAAELAQRSDNPQDLDSGAYPVVLGYEAVATIVSFLAYTGLSAKAFHEGSSFLSGKLGEQIVSEAISISDDAFAPGQLGLTFDYEGVPKNRIPLITNGVAIQPVSDSYWAARTGLRNTGNALPAPNAFGPYPLNLEMAGGTAQLDELIGAVERGIYVTRFHYANVEDPIPVMLTGMTRDGTFLIEDGRITRPVKNLRFTQGMIEALSNVGGVTASRRLVGERGETAHVPALLLDRFSFTGQTS